MPTRITPPPAVAERMTPSAKFSIVVVTPAPVS